MTEIPDRPFDKIAIDLVTDCAKHPLRQQAHFDHNRSPDKLARSFSHPWQICMDTIVATLINHYLPVHMCPRYILSDNGMEFKNNLMDQVFATTGNR